MAFGEILWDIFSEYRRLGGAPFNFAARMSMLGHKALMVSRVGRDDFGEEALTTAQSLGLDTSLVQIDTRKNTGTVDVFINERGQPDFTINPNVAYDRIEWRDELATALAQCDCFCFGTLIQRSPVSRKTLRRLLEVPSEAFRILDINLRKNGSSIEAIRYSLDHTHALKLNESEAKAVTTVLNLGKCSIPKFCREMIEFYGLRYCLVTLGEKGAFAMAASGKAVYSPGFRVKVADTVGSGDAFTAGFVHRILSNGTLDDACRYGNLLGAIVATQSGATQPVTGRDIEAFLDSEPPLIIEPALEKYI